MEEKADGSNVRAGAKVYVRDDAYAWLPAEVIEAPSEDGAATASVRVALPDDWAAHTCEPPAVRLPSPRRGFGAAAARRGSGGFGAAAARRGSGGGFASSEPSPGDGTVLTVNLADYAGGELPLQNVDDGGGILGKSDMADLPHLHEAAILYNLKDRHKRGVPYTRVGDIVVAVNPYQWIDGLYSKEKQRIYAEKLVWNAQADDFSNRKEILEGYFDKILHEPHVYETSSHAYRGLIVDGQDQAILVSGESGAGKTETVKIMMTHLATLANTRHVSAPSDEGGVNDLAGIVKQVLDSNPLFESFGNATTVANGNSSRFGKFTKLHFKADENETVMMEGKNDVPISVLSGSTFQTYLLEKTRVISHDMGERTYHLFYQLLSAPEEEKVEFWEGLRGTDCESFRYVGEPDTRAIDGLTDAEAWIETRKALLNFGFRGEVLRSLIRAVCTVLQLGNLTFDLDPSDEDGNLLTPEEELKKVSDLMGVASDVIRDALTTRRVKTAGEEIIVRQTPTAAKDGCDALAKEIYAQVFQVLVLTINESTSPPPPPKDGAKKMGCISILDMFGFESFQVNRFEQLCINYANERIQNKYVSDTFLAVREEYSNEGIDVYDFSKVDNSDVLNLIEGRTGLIMVLNEECVRPKGNDESFVYKIKMIHRDSKRLVYDRLQKPNEFSIRHFAGTVKYDSTKSVEQNTDQLPKILLDCASGSTNKVIRYGFRRLAALKAKEQVNFKRKRVAATIGSKFKSQLAMLMKDIKDSRTRYIRCIKPNNERQPFVMDHNMTMKQLASAGLVTAITVSRETFPNRLMYEVVWDRFRILLDHANPGGTVEEKARYLLAELLQGKEKVVGGHVIAPFACGRTKVFFRSGSLELLQSQRHDLYSAKAAVFQRWARGFIARRKYRATRSSIITLQTKWRQVAARKNYHDKQNAALSIQCWGRCHMAFAYVRLLRKLKAATIVQSCWRAQGPRKVLRQSKDAVGVIQRAIRSRKKEVTYKSSWTTVVEEAQMDHKMKKLQEKLDESAPQDDDALLRESAKMIEYLSRQLFAYRGKVSYLKTELTKEKEKDSRLATHAGSVGAALAANKLEVAKLRQSSRRLSTQLNEFKVEKVSTRETLKSMQDEHRSQMLKQQERHNAKERSLTLEVDKLKNEMKAMKREHVAEISELKNQMTQSEADHRTEVTRLQGELQQMEESYEDDLAKMLDALETTKEDTDVIVKVPEEESARELRSAIKTAMTDIDVRSALCEKCAEIVFPSTGGPDVGSPNRLVARHFARKYVEDNQIK